MASEPRFNLRAVTSRIPVDLYAKLIQKVDGDHTYKDVSECVRYCIKTCMGCVELDEERIAWVEAEKKRNMETRERNRARRRSFIHKLFGR